MTYRPGYSEAHSPTYVEGAERGAEDRIRVENCPPEEPIGLEPDRGAMYKRGYNGAMALANPHQCTGKCTN